MNRYILHTESALASLNGVTRTIRYDTKIHNLRSKPNLLHEDDKMENKLTKKNSEINYHRRSGLSPSLQRHPLT